MPVVVRQSATTQTVLGSPSVAVLRVQRQDRRITVSTQRQTPSDPIASRRTSTPTLSRMEQVNQEKVPMQSPSMSGKEPVERGEDDQGYHQTNDAVGGRTALWQPAHHPKGWELTARSPMWKQWADNWEGAAPE